MIEVIALAPSGFSRKEVDNFRQAVIQAEWLLETGATKIGIYVFKGAKPECKPECNETADSRKPTQVVGEVVPEAGIEPATKGL